MLAAHAIVHVCVWCVGAALVYSVSGVPLNNVSVVHSNFPAFDDTTQPLEVGVHAWSDAAHTYSLLEVQGAVHWPGITFQSCPAGELRFSSGSVGSFIVWALPGLAPVTHTTGIQRRAAPSPWTWTEAAGRFSIFSSRGCPWGPWSSCPSPAPSSGASASGSRSGSVTHSLG